MLNMGNINKTFALLLTLTIAMSSLTVLTIKSVAAQPTPYPLLTPSTIAPPKIYSVPPLSSLRLTIHLIHGEPFRGFVHIKGGSGNDINFGIINPDGKIILDLGRISNETSFKFYADKRGNFTIILDNEFSVFSSKEVNVSNSYPNNLFEVAGFSINVWAIILVIISVAALLTFGVYFSRHRKR